MNRAHALVVDDEIHSRELLSELLQAMRFEVTEADSGSEALERIRKSRYDIVITDWVMPGMDGLSLIKQAKASTPMSPSSWSRVTPRSTGPSR